MARSALAIGLEAFYSNFFLAKPEFFFLRFIERVQSGAFLLLYVAQGAFFQRFIHKRTVLRQVISI
ncbi:hypothetical protein D3C72_1831230 [compost metagenome]